MVYNGLALGTFVDIHNMTPQRWNRQFCGLPDTDGVLSGWC